MCIFRCMHSSLWCNPRDNSRFSPQPIPPSDPSQIIPYTSSITNEVFYTNRHTVTFLSVVLEAHTDLRHTNNINRMNRTGQPVALNGTVSPIDLSRQGSSLPGGSGPIYPKFRSWSREICTRYCSRLRCKKYIHARGGMLSIFAMQDGIRAYAECRESTVEFRIYRQLI